MRGAMLDAHVGKVQGNQSDEPTLVPPPREAWLRLCDDELQGGGSEPVGSASKIGRRLTSTAGDVSQSLSLMKGLLLGEVPVCAFKELSWGVGSFGHLSH